MIGLGEPPGPHPVQPMPPSLSVLERFRAAASRHLAVLDMLDVPRAFERDHAIIPKHAKMLHDSVDVLRETLREAEQLG